MRRFAYERPASLAEATRILAEAGDGARILAGGTDLVVGLRDDSIRPDVVVDLKWVEELQVETIVRAGGVYTFNALATMTRIEHDERVLAELPALAEAARVVGSVQIRNRATLVGNICNGSPAADTAPPLLLHGAVVVIVGPDGQRRQPIESAPQIHRRRRYEHPHAGGDREHQRVLRRPSTATASSRRDAPEKRTVNPPGRVTSIVAVPSSLAAPAAMWIASA